MKKIIAFMLTVCMFISVVACGGKEATESVEPAAPEEEVKASTEESETSTEKSYKIGYSHKNASANWSATEVKEYQRIAEERGIELIITDSAKDQEKQISDVNDLIAQGCDAIIIYPVDAEGCAPAFAACNEAGVPVFCMNNAFNSGVAGKDYISFVRSDQYSQGVTCANWVLDTFGTEEELTVLEITLTMGSSDAQNRYAGFHDTLDQYENYTVITQSGEGSATTAQNLAQNAVQAQEIDIIYCHSDLMARGALLGIQQAGYKGTKDIAIITCDCDFEDMDLMKTGEGITACVTVSPKSGVPIMLDAVEAYLAGEPYEDEYVISETLVTLDNVDELYDQVGY